MRWASTSCAVQRRPGIATPDSVSSSWLPRTSVRWARAPRISARKSALLTPSLAPRPCGRSMSGESGFQLLEIALERPGRPDDPHERAEEGVVDLAPFGDGHRRGVVALGGDLERPRAPE